MSSFFIQITNIFWLHAVRGISWNSPFWTTKWQIAWTGYYIVANSSYEIVVNDIFNGAELEYFLEVKENVENKSAWIEPEFSIQDRTGQDRT